MKSRSRWIRALFASACLCGAGVASAEKYPSTLDRNNIPGALSNAANLRLGELASGVLDGQINQSSTQIRMSPGGIARMRSLHASGLSADDKTGQLVTSINQDMSGYGSATSPAPGLRVSFSPQYNVARLTWDRDVVTRFLCTYISANQANIFTLSEEAEYSIYRNGRLLTRIPGAFVQGSVGSIAGIPYTRTPTLPGGEGTPTFFDFDPFQGPPGTPLHYEVWAIRKGCTQAFIPGGYVIEAGRSGVRSGQVFVDANGDVAPDFMPTTVWQAKLATQDSGPSPPPPPPGPGNLSFAAGALVMAAGETRTNGSLTFAFQTDGNLVVYGAGGARWASNTGGRNCSSGCIAAFHAEGNLVLYQNGAWYWATQTSYAAGATLRVSDQAPYIQVVGPDGTTFYSSESRIAAATGFRLPGVSSAWFQGGRLSFQNDGNLVVYDAYDNPLWASNTTGRACTPETCIAVFQFDGNLVLYDNGSPYWATATMAGAASRMSIGTDYPTITITDDAGNLLWAAE